VLFERCDDRLQLESQSDSRLLVLTGQPIGEPVVGQGPFVMNTREEIRQAIVDYQAGRMGHLNGHNESR
jgi:quercetin 2,3-dioxygenase